MWHLAILEFRVANKKFLPSIVYVHLDVSTLSSLTWVIQYNGHHYYLASGSKAGAASHFHVSHNIRALYICIQHTYLISLNATTFNTNIGGSENRMNNVLQAYQNIIPDLYFYFLGLFFNPSLTFDFFLSRYHLFHFSQFSVMATKLCTMDIYININYLAEK